MRIEVCFSKKPFSIRLPHNTERMRKLSNLNFASNFNFIP